MANSTVPILHGFDYQARWFWLQACRLFSDYQKVIRVGYELDSVKSFDDVAVYYSSPIVDTVTGERISVDYYQIKFHIDSVGAVSYENLMDPSFIGAKSESLLNKVLVAQKLLTTGDAGCRFYLAVPWPILQKDPLADLIGKCDGEIRFDVLFNPRSGPTSRIGRVREAWREHLGLSSDGELARALRPLRIKANAQDLADLNDRLSDKLNIAGMEPLDPNQYNRYDDVIRKARAQGRKVFTRDDIQAICEQNNLWRGCSITNDQVVSIGIRSFLRWAEYMEDETEAMICLAQYFDGRRIEKRESWNDAIAPSVAGFLSLNIQRGRIHHVYLDTHTSVAFLAGYCLDSKCGAEVIPIQKTRRKSEIWKPAPCAAVDAFSSWASECVKCGTGPDVALSISATHDVMKDVQSYVSRVLPSVGRIISCKTMPTPSPTAVQGASHALFLSQQLAAFVKGERTDTERGAVMHIFASAPNGLVFFIGQLARGFGRCILYEYDFEANALGAYEPSIALPAGSKRNIEL
jgi:hypothetical protein